MLDNNEMMELTVLCEQDYCTFTEDNTCCYDCEHLEQCKKAGGACDKFDRDGYIESITSCKHANII